MCRCAGTMLVNVGVTQICVCVSCWMMSLLIPSGNGQGEVKVPGQHINSGSWLPSGVLVDVLHEIKHNRWQYNIWVEIQVCTCTGSLCLHMYESEMFVQVNTNMSKQCVSCTDDPWRSRVDLWSPESWRLPPASVAVTPHLLLRNSAAWNLPSTWVPLMIRTLESLERWVHNWHCFTTTWMKWYTLGWACNVVVRLDDWRDRAHNEDEWLQMWLNASTAWMNYDPKLML